ncbi:hypothetical protein [Citrobacter sp. Cpo102]|uniref:hypothetical protein n=1 Tax=Citrobacter sp. Cpo102 TaxID=2985142 RepID=UPI0025765A13|nr:hypothetical protein [Citrobacter sp. Cpo102]MDM2816921.1 hypothetical protein [Citrobacter sp. Cpo102]
MDTDLTLSALLTQRCVEFSHSKKAVEIIDNGIEKMFKELVDDAFRSYGDFGKSAREAFKAALPANIDNLIELSRYNEMIANALRTKWTESGIADDMLRKADEALAEVMQDNSVPEYIKLSTIFDGFIEDNREEAFENQWEAPDFRLEEERGFIHLYFDKRPDKDFDSLRYSSRTERNKYELEHNLAARIVDCEQVDGHPVYEIYSAKLDDTEIRKITSLGLVRSNWERALVALYYGQSKLVLDCDPDDYAYPGADY